MSIRLIFKAVMAALLVSFGSTALAQCIPMNAPGPPRIWDGQRGCYVPQGTPAYGQQIVQQVVPIPTAVQQQFIPNGYAGYGQQLPAGVQLLQPSAAMAGGLNRCEAVGGIVGATLGSFARHHQVQGVVLGAIAGGIVGNAVCTNNQGQRVMVVQQPIQQQSPRQPAQPRNPCAHDPGTQQGVLNLPGHTMNGQTVCARPGDTNISKWID